MRDNHTPRSPLRDLSATDMQLLDEIRYLSELQARINGTGSYYARPSRRYLALKTGVCITTVSRRISRLERLGYITRTQRRPRLGRYQTNLYTLQQLLATGARRLTASLKAALSRVTGVSRKPKNLKPLGARGVPDGTCSGDARAAETQSSDTTPAERQRHQDAALSALAKMRLILTPQTPQATG